jgi:hypothetical protein
VLAAAPPWRPTSAERGVLLPLAVLAAAPQWRPTAAERGVLLPLVAKAAWARRGGMLMLRARQRAAAAALDEGMAREAARAWLASN